MASLSLTCTASSGRERLTQAGAMSGEAAQVARPTAVDVLLQQFGWQSAVVEQRWPGVWMSSDPAHQHASTKASRLAGVEAASKRIVWQPTAATRVLFAASLLKRDVSRRPVEW